MPLYEVIKGATYPFGGRELQSGEQIDLTEGQAAPWLDLLLKPVAEPKVKRAQGAPAKSEGEVENNVG